MNIFVCGDLHGQFYSVRNFYENSVKGNPVEEEENWMLCLGDFGAQFYFDYRDRNFKEKLGKFPFKYFVIRGNHEERASNRAAAEPDAWEEVNIFEGICLREKAYPHIYYAYDEGGVYNIDGRKTLVIPGAYSVDKWYRLRQGWSWFPDEQLTGQEMARLPKDYAWNHYDLVLSHSCPYQFRPTDLFLASIDQSTVDTSMELWMSQLSEKITWGVWCFGHYHEDRIEGPRVEMFYREIEPLNKIEERWNRYAETEELDWWIPKSPNFYQHTTNRGKME